MNVEIFEVYSRRIGTTQETLEALFATREAANARALAGNCKPFTPFFWRVQIRKG